MRIVGGIYRHRLIEYPNDAEHIRPTKDRIREAIFSAVGDLTNRIGLDLYSGSGAMGIEGLSRGASFMTFVDHNRVAIDKEEYFFFRNKKRRSVIHGRYSGVREVQTRKEEI